MKALSALMVLSSLFSNSVVAAPRLVGISIDGVAAGSIVIKESERALYLKVDERSALRYAVATPKETMRWSGPAKVIAKDLRPAWSPPAIVKRAKPGIPNYIAGGAPNNPMGAAAISLDRTEIAIHGTAASMRGSIGTAASFGCIRMFDEDVLDLFERVHVGTYVYMMP